MNKKIRWITETAVMLALLIALQAVTKPMSQLVTGSCVNAILAITVLLVGMSSGITVALISPVFAFLLHIAPNAVTVVPIMIGNVCYVVLLRLIAGKSVWRRIVALVAASAVKFGVLYLLVVKVICGVASSSFPKKLPDMFTWPQLTTALIGGAVALLITPVLKKALHK